jgi:hypothetical protein
MRSFIREGGRPCAPSRLEKVMAGHVLIKKTKACYDLIMFNINIIKGISIKFTLIGWQFGCWKFCHSYYIKRWARKIKLIALIEYYTKKKVR